ncbi:MAG: phosphatase PAP2 family protein [Gemmatimonadaceae bacterium]
MSIVTSQPLLARLDAHDRALMARFVLGKSHSRAHCAWWLTLTHLGGARFSIAMTFALLTVGIGQPLFVRSAISLALSHIIVRIIKRRAERVRPSASMSLEALVVIPDKFSFPSGHACAAMSTAITYAILFPAAAPIIVLVAFFIGASRVALGVHFPGDVVVGQLIALIVSAALFL